MCLMFDLKYTRVTSTMAHKEPHSSVRIGGF